MNFNADVLGERLRSLGADSSTRFLVAFSGGVDSTALLAALATFGAERVRAIHVHHGLQPQADEWLHHCEQLATSLGVAFLGRRVVVESGAGPEASARDARYAALAEALTSGEWLLTAHHQDDQAETLLLRLLRSAGPRGLAAMQASQPFADGRLVRPLLDVPRLALEAFVAHAGLDFCTDPSNEQTHYDRSFLRREVMPALAARWPAASPSLATAARLQRECTSLLDTLAGEDLQQAGGDPSRLDLAALDDPARFQNLLRYSLRLLAFPDPGRRRLDDFTEALRNSAADAQPALHWHSHSLRRYAGRLYLERELAQPADGRLTVDGECVLGAGLGRLRLRPADSGIAKSRIAGGLDVRFRVGGERLCLPGRAGSRSLKQLLQEARIPPWRRDVMPLLYAGDTLLAVADRWIDEAALGEPAFQVEWLDPPRLD